MNWKDGELRHVSITFPQKVPNKETTFRRQCELEIPLIYVQIIDQLWTEFDHTRHTKAHEALRRGAYASDILKHLGKELKKYKGPGAKFRSQVLNPILQRYLRGIPDCYTPIVQEAIAHTSAEVKKALTIKQGDDAEDDAEDDAGDDAGEGTKPTILGATVFYLSVDPVDEENIPLYRRNLVYLAESRWHLAILADETLVEDEDFFKTTRVDHHDYVMEAYQDQLQEGPPQRNQDNEVTPFSEAEVEVILAEGLDWFFEEDLEDYVSKVHLSPYFTITDHHDFTRMSSSVRSRPGGSQESQEESPH